MTRRPVGVPVALWLLGACGLCSVGAATPPDRSLLLDVVVNGEPVGKIGDFRQVGDELLASRHELEDLGLKPGPGDLQELLKLQAVPSVTYQLDEAKQVLRITAPMASLRPNEIGPARDQSALPAIVSGTGFVLNYDANATVAGGRMLAEALLDARLFSPWGVADASFLGRVGSERDAVRLDTTYTYTDAESLRRLRAGDVITSGLEWTRPFRLGGLQFARDFSIRPDLVTFPVPSIAGQVAVPSTVDVLVNGIQQFSSPVAPGPFEIRSLPIVNGTNNVALVINDALGRQVQQNLPVYASHAMLAPGLDAFSVEAGAVRLRYGLVSNDYRDLAVSASYRRGVADWLTLDTHVEAMRSLEMGGAGATVAVGTFGALSLTLAQSRAAGRQGFLGYAAFERVTPQLSLSASMQLTDGKFSDVAAAYGEPVPRRQFRAGLGVPLGDAGSISLSYTGQRRAAVVGQAPTVLDPDGITSYAAPLRLSLLAASYTVPVLHGRAFFYATAFRDFNNHGSSGGVFGLTLPLGQRTSLSVAAGEEGGRGYGTVQASRSVDAVGDAGGQLFMDAGDASRLLALGQYKSSIGEFGLGADHAGGRTSLRGSATGALAIADGGLFATNTISDSFAVVDTDGAQGVQVAYENRPVERTGSSGRVLVPDLRSFESNRISIDPTDIPLDAEVGSVVQTVRPPDRSGVVVRFPVKRNRSALLSLVGRGGSAVPVGSRLQIEPDGAETTVGYGGEAFVSGLQPHNRARVTIAGQQQCRVEFDYRPVQGSIPSIGPLTCVPVQE